jgi:hypothetical protein
MYGRHGLPPTNPDPDLIAKHHRGISFQARFGSTLIMVGALIALLVVLSIIGALL